jgi:hypothetical protein
MSKRERHWRRKVAEFKSSGLSRAAFCRRRRVNYHTMTYWVKRLANLDGPGAGGDARASFVEVSLPSGAADATLEWNRPATYEVRLGNGRSIRLGVDFEDEAVARLIRTLESC